ncbi:putative sporulation protein YyaC [Salirhabdus euzebyi]|uniref:Putative sporulation protein YyaC n=1 Tax=Salirhabdus euzebyi TaxID=394506 RepID=A0A841Q7Y7_9BACI|nr:spore protease YyaC [Salirhabdus euzebyi]MBB6454434.1 putative sporulation protein YyaC [Salirhabdus euzebyi]
MNLKQILFPKKQEKRFYYAHPSSAYRLAKTLYSWIPNRDQEIIIVCIGTDRSTGDSLGPIVGSLLSEHHLPQFSIYGTLDSPVHAKNLEDRLEDIKQNHSNAFIIAIDACLGKQSSIGSIIAGVGSIKPGAAVQKQLPDVGDLYLSGVVNLSGYMEYFVLQNTRLSIVMNMAKQTSQALRFLHYFLQKDTTEEIVEEKEEG